MNIDDTALGLALNPQRIRDLTGAARATHLRFKPGTGLTAALLDADGAPTGWLRVLADGEEKLANARRRAQRRGFAVGAAQLEGGLAFWGSLLADPGLERAFRDLPQELPARWRVLRYNPLRRLVVHLPEAGAAGRLTHDRQDHLRDAAARVSRQVPTVARLTDRSLPQSSRVTWWDWCDGGDLATQHSPEAAYEAGQLTAQLHRITPLPGSDIRHVAEAQLQANLRLLGALDTGLGARLAHAVEALLPQLTTGEAAVTSHGDLSADQFFLKGTRVRLGDLDRVTGGPAAFDLGSFAATSRAHVDSFLAGYHEHSPHPVGPLHAWTGYAHAIRVTEPFRAAAPDWREQTSARIRTIEETLCSSS